MSTDANLGISSYDKDLAPRVMNLYLLRHGIAEERSATGRDHDRELTEEGRDKLSKLLQRAAHAGVKPDLILTSPLVRAVQTAELAARILKCPEPVMTEAIVPYGTPAELWEEVRGCAEYERVLLASHEPLLSQSVSFLLDSPSLKVEMKKGAMVSIVFDSLRGAPRGTLEWMLIPRLCS